MPVLANQLLMPLAMALSAEDDDIAMVTRLITFVMMVIVTATSAEVTTLLATHRICRRPPAGSDVHFNQFVGLFLISTTGECLPQ